MLLSFLWYTYSHPLFISLSLSLPGGTGYIAQHVIHTLTHFGLKSRLLIYCRGKFFYVYICLYFLSFYFIFKGDITASIWRSKGYFAHHMIPKLLNAYGHTVKPDVFVSFTRSFIFTPLYLISHLISPRFISHIYSIFYLLSFSNSSFTQVCRGLAGLVTQSSVFLFCSLGLARQKAYYMFRSPTVFRTYLEPFLCTYRYEVS